MEKTGVKKNSKEGEDSINEFWIGLYEIINTQFVNKLESERNTVKKLIGKIKFGKDREQLQMLYDQLNKISSEIILLSDILESYLQ